MTWISRNAETVEAVSTMITAVVAIVALIGVKLQVDAADELQRIQSARDAYRAHLALAVSNPRYSQPEDVCPLLASGEARAYTAFVDHLLYAAEQMLAVGDGWDATFLDQLEPHRVYLCSEGAPVGETDEMSRLISGFVAEKCAATPGC